MRVVTGGLFVAALLAMTATFVAAQDDEADIDVLPDEVVDEDDEGLELPQETLGLLATSYFPLYADGKIPAGERIEVLIPINSAPENPEYEVSLVAGHLATVDHSRFIQNFSVQTYQRRLEGGQTMTVKYTMTPDVALDPIEYSLVIATYLRNDDNKTLLLAAFNGTVTIQDPLGFDYQGAFTLLVLGGGVAGGLYYYFVALAPSAPKASTRQRSAAAASERSDSTSRTASPTGVDKDFLDKSHLAYLASKKSKSARSASPKSKSE